MLDRVHQTTIADMHSHRSNREFDLSFPLRSFLDTAIKILTKPKEFFENISRGGNLRAPLVFAITCNTIPLLVSALYTAVVSLASGDVIAQNVREFLAAQESWVAVLLALLIPPLILLLTILIAALIVYIVALILHLLVTIFVRPNAGFEATFRVNAYASVVTLANQIPLVGILASLYGIYLFWTGVQQLHPATARQATLVVIVPILYVVGTQTFVVVDVLRNL